MYYNSYTIGGELYHHGVEGQKWGVMHGPPYPLGSNISTGSKLKIKTDKYKNRERRKIEGTYGRHKQNMDKSIQKREEKYKKKYDKIKSTAKTDEEKDKKLNKLDSKYNKKMNRKLKDREYLERIINAELDKIDQIEDYRVDKKNLRGQKILKALNTGFWGGIPGAILNMDDTGSSADVQRTSKKEREEIRKQVYGMKDSDLALKRYEERSKENKEGTKANNQQSKLRKAKKSGIYDINFLEAIQNSMMLYDNDAKSINKEYEVYLKDPEAYWKRARNLPQA